MTDDGEPLGEPVFRRRRVPPEVRLFQAKVLQHVQDAVCGSGKGEAAFHRDYARRWLRPENEQFRAFCLGAGWEPDLIAGWVARGGYRNERLRKESA